eukprot:gene2799-2033_t
MDDVAVEAGFVFVDDVCAGVLQQLRYSTEENFMGTVVHGYGGRRAILTKEAAEALAAVEAAVAQDGYRLLIYDTYRPQKAVDHFATWSEDAADVLKQAEYYPRVDKSRVFELGYVAKRSGHSRGSTVDLTLVPLATTALQLVFPPRVEQRRFRVVDGDGVASDVALPYLDDGSVDMGTSFDLMDAASHFACPFVPPAAQERRLYLRRVMTEHGFRPYDEEWWHFTFADEPHRDEYFDFDVPR